MKQFKKIVLVLGLAIAVSGATVAFAQDDTDVDVEAPEIPAECAWQTPLTLEELADAFGITVEDLQAMIDDGMRVREIADELDVELPVREQPTDEQIEACHQARQEQLAEQLGITVEELQTRLDDGQTIREIADELGVELPEPPRRPEDRPFNGNPAFQGEPPYDGQPPFGDGDEFNGQPPFDGQPPFNNNQPSDTPNSAPSGPGANSNNGPANGGPGNGGGQPPVAPGGNRNGA